jgi:CRP-like cAMP-binding protein
MSELCESNFDVEAYLASAGPGRTIVQLRDNQALFLQGQSADSVYYLQSGGAKLTISRNGKEATITHLSAGEFMGEESLSGTSALHTATATSTTDCAALKIERGEMIRVMHEELALSERFFIFLLARGMRIESDLVDQLFNSSERRLAKTLLLMANFGDIDASERLIPEITEERLAEIVGTTRSTVGFFMNRFCKLGLIDYNGGLRVRKTLLNVILHDEFPGDNTAKPAIEDIPRNHERQSAEPYLS